MLNTIISAVTAYLSTNLDYLGFLMAFFAQSKAPKKYRYILMKGKADGSSLDLLETKFSRERDNAFIRSLTNSVKGFEYRSRKQAEALERARLLNEQAEQLKKEADKLGKP